MDIRIYLTCLWPGLSELWWRGRLSALPLAIGFAIGLNSLLVLKYLYPTWLDPLLVRSAWWVGAILWVCWSVKSVRELPELLSPRAVTDQPDRFDEAHQAYLQADWPNCERLLLGILAIEPRDPPSLLLLSGVYRHTGRWEHAESLISELERLEVAAAWEIEIEAERARIEQFSHPDDEHEEAEDDDSEPSPDSSTQPPAADAGGDAADLTAA
ncbi:hypothetical protein NHH03_20105 [Stieleria sp. TO1_6]|uniref:hypothetical protein n=1 Tax=Stieleria tagensis TaxID=2956795 RepID=UPI00209A98C3|nr:hypothetical protein [Stieleria tagensis]MCO8124059.1 hypothetical protein [Stieleria tagensis]